MNIQVFREPGLFFIVNDFISMDAQNMFLESLIQKDFERGKFIESSNSANEAEAAELVLDETTKKVDSFELTRQNPFINYFLERFYSDRMLHAFEQSGDELFSLLTFLREGSYQVSRFGEGYFYDNHRDYALISANLYLAHQDKVPFQGGDLYVRGFRIPFQPRTLVVFPGSYRHRVGRVTNVPSSLLSHRYSLQYWPAFCNKH